MDAALRSAYYLVTGENPDPDAFAAVRGMQGWKEASFDIPGAGTVRTAVVSGLGNTRELMEAIASGHVQYDFVEVMACPGGCIAGAGTLADPARSAMMLNKYKAQATMKTAADTPYKDTLDKLKY